MAVEVSLCFLTQQSTNKTIATCIRNIMLLWSIWSILENIKVFWIIIDWIHITSCSEHFKACHDWRRNIQEMRMYATHLKFRSCSGSKGEEQCRLTAPGGVPHNLRLRKAMPSLTAAGVTTSPAPPPTPPPPPPSSDPLALSCCSMAHQHQVTGDGNYHHNDDNSSGWAARRVMAGRFITSSNQCWAGTEFGGV